MYSNKDFDKGLFMQICFSLRMLTAESSGSVVFSSVSNEKGCPLRRRYISVAKRERAGWRNEI